MKKIFLTFLSVFFITVSTVCSEPVTFIQVTDVHLTHTNSDYLKNFVEDINKISDKIDFVAFTGDNIDKANKDNLDLFLNTVKNLKVKAYITVGNHDLFKSNDMTGDYYMKRIREILGSYHPASTNYTFKQGNLIFIVMNGVKEVIPGPNGYYKNDELVWLDKQLSRYKDKKVVILQHFPLLDTPSKTADLYRKEEYFKVLNKHDNVISVISGHYHNNREENIGGIYHIVTQKFSNNTYYKIITIDDEDGFIYTSLIDKSAICMD